MNISIALDFMMMDTICRSVVTSGENEVMESHVVAYYKPGALRTCSRCHCQFLPQLSRLRPSSIHEQSNRSSSAGGHGELCRYHAGFYVCRFHPAETKLSIQSGDGLGYYGNGQEGMER
jgi:hypothetical protein